MPEDRLEFRGEYQPSSRRRIEKRLFPNPVSSQQEHFLALVPYRKSEHASKFLGHIRSEFFIRVDNGFGVTPRIEEMSFRFEFGSQVRIVVNLAVQHHPNGLIFIVNRLLA